MAQLIHMRQRIKAVETIKKITHAMRLISMSTHSRLRNKKAQFEEYKRAFLELTATIKPVEASLIEGPIASKQLIILIASQKGLCGAFNTHLFKYFELDYPVIPVSTDIISVGKHATDYIIQHQNPLMQFNEFTSAQFVSIALQITDFILNHQTDYTQVLVYSNYARTFFVQKPQKMVLLPISTTEIIPNASSQVTQDYIFEDDQATLYDYIKKMLITITIEELLFESLLAEQSARFLSMDASTRNADNLLISMKLEYNKTRQAAITRELTELSSSL